MIFKLARLQSREAILSALAEFSTLGRTAFLQRYGFGRTRGFQVRNPASGELCDAKAILAAAYGFQFSIEGPLKSADFSSEEDAVPSKLRSLGFEAIRAGQDWSQKEVDATVAAYFDMLLLEGKQEKYNKSERNSLLRPMLNGRTKASVELKHQNISAVLNDLDLPYIPGYKPRGNTQLLLRKAVQSFIHRHDDVLISLADALEEVKAPAGKQYRAVHVAPPTMRDVAQSNPSKVRERKPRKVDFAARDEANRRLGRCGEEWVLGYEQERLTSIGMPQLFQKVEWISETMGDGAGYDILSFDAADRQRYIEVKTTNGAHASPFVISRNELEFSKEAGDEFHLYRVFEYRISPRLYILDGDLSQQLHLEPIDYRASFKRIRE